MRTHFACLLEQPKCGYWVKLGLERPEREVQLMRWTRYYLRRLLLLNRDLMEEEFVEQVESAIQSDDPKAIDDTRDKMQRLPLFENIVTVLDEHNELFEPDIAHDRYFYQYRRISVAGVRLIFSCPIPESITIFDQSSPTTSSLIKHMVNSLLH